MVLRRKLYIQILKYFAQLKIAVHEIPAVIGFCIFLVLVSQLFSGVMMSFSIIPEPMYVSLEREVEDCENVYQDDFTLLHERGVDLLMILLYLHLCRKSYICSCNVEQEVAWKHGVILFWGIHLVIFLGLVLCCTHLSEITLTIAAQIVYTLFLFTGKIYWLFLTDKLLNIDTLVRLAYSHYCLGFIVFFFSIYHGMDMHYDWTCAEPFDGITAELDWCDEGLINEFHACCNIIVIFCMLCWFYYLQPEPLSYELFSWGEVGLNTELRFLSVAPHWYFRPYMGWLVACPFYYTGLIGLGLFIIIFYFQPNILNFNENGSYAMVRNFFLYKFFSFARYAGLGKRLRKWVVLERIQTHYSYIAEYSYTVFLIALWYTFSYLPFGRFFQSLGGNPASICTYGYLFIYLGGSSLRKPQFYQLLRRLVM